MERFIPIPIRELFTDAVKRVSRPLGRDVIARTFEQIERNPELHSRYRHECEKHEKREWTVNRFGAITVKGLLGWERDESGPHSAVPFTTLIKTYTRLVPSGEDEEPAEGHEDEGSGKAADVERPEPRVASLPRLKDWVTVSQAAEILGLSRAAAHKMFVTREFKSVHRLGDKLKPILVVLRSEVEVEAARRDAAKREIGQQTRVIPIVKAPFQEEPWVEAAFGGPLNPARDQRRVQGQSGHRVKDWDEEMAPILDPDTQPDTPAEA
jgi:hypothetical protein